MYCSDPVCSGPIQHAATYFKNEKRFPYKHRTGTSTRGQAWFCVTNSHKRWSLIALHERVLTSRKVLSTVCAVLLLTCSLAVAIRIAVERGKTTRLPGVNGAPTESSLIWHPTAKRFMPAETRSNLEERFYIEQRLRETSPTPQQ